MKRLFVVLVLNAALAACAHVRPAVPLTLGPSDSGKGLSLTVGQVVTVRLPSNPGTGYRWDIANDPDARMLIVVDSGYDRPAATAPGAAGVAWWKLRATGPGETTFAVRYVRPWQPEEKAQQFTVNVVVTPEK